MAQVDMFLKLDGIKGESQDDKHKDEMQLKSWSWGNAQAGSASTGGGMGTGKVVFHDFSFTKSQDSASPYLMLACASGQHIASGVLTLRKAGGTQQDYSTVTLNDFIVSSFTTAHDGTDVVESVSLNFTQIQYEYHAQDAKGNLGGAIKTGWNVKTNKKI